MKVFVKTYGCTFNVRDSENIKGILKNEEYEIVDNEESADMIVVNSCGVKGVTQNKVISYIESRDKPVYVGGCLTKMVDLTEKKNVQGVFDPNTITKLPEQIKEKKVQSFGGKKEHRVNIPMLRSEKDKIILPISQGCLGNCSYCSVKYVRGNLKSYRIGDLKREVEVAVQEDEIKHVYLTSQDCGCYGFDIETNLVELVKEIIEVPGEFIIRIGMMSPEHIITYLPELLKIMKHPKVKNFLHLPLQAGSNKVLKDMRRKYTIEEYRKLIQDIRKTSPEIHIATDIIVGYPTETEEDFQETVNIIKEFKFEVVNVSKFASRPKTLAAKLKPLLTQEVKRRSSILHKMIN
jgi:threonylcarbamoyladenosine tRNA methylthiotransferase CDKAL1